jgi:hypothetical protein
MAEAPSGGSVTDEPTVRPSFPTTSAPTRKRTASASRYRGESPKGPTIPGPNVCLSVGTVS